MGEHVLWVVGTIRPLPEGFTKQPWSGPRLQQVAADATIYVGPPMIETRISNPLAALNALRHYNALRRIPQRQTLADLLPAAMYVRFEQMRQRLGVRSRSVTRLRPMLAANKLLGVALKKNGLTDRDFSKSVRRLAKRNGASTVQPEVKVSIGEAVVLIRSLPESIELECMQATLDYLENDIHNAELTASLWRDGRLSYPAGSAWGNAGFVRKVGAKHPPATKKRVKKCTLAIPATELQLVSKTDSELVLISRQGAKKQTIHLVRTSPEMPDFSELTDAHWLKHH